MKPFSITPMGFLPCIACPLAILMLGLSVAVRAADPIAPPHPLYTEAPGTPDGVLCPAVPESLTCMLRTAAGALPACCPACSSWSCRAWCVAREAAGSCGLTDRVSVSDRTWQKLW